MRSVIAVVAALAISSTGSLAAQANRHELGLRLRSFERALAATEDGARRDAAFVAVDGGAVPVRGLLAWEDEELRGVEHLGDAASLLERRGGAPGAPRGRGGAPRGGRRRRRR